MQRILIAAAAVLAIAACGDTQDADENPRDLNVVDNFTGPGDPLQPPTGNGSTVIPTENGLIIHVPVEPAGNVGAPVGSDANAAGNSGE